jgi:hypothetical protein
MRRIAAIYGLGSIPPLPLDADTPRAVGELGWNRRLLAATGAPNDPREAAVRILRMVRQLAGTSVSHRPADGP